jgi:tetratricopeptide (TPR) repeat protein
MNCYKHALRLDPAYAEVYINIALCYIRQGKDEMAVKNLDKALGLNVNLLTYIMGEEKEFDRLKNNTGFNRLQKKYRHGNTL